MHRVPIDDNTALQKWIKANPRQDWKPTASSKICSIHFNDDDFEVSSVDTNQDRRKKTEQNTVWTAFPPTTEKGCST